MARSLRALWHGPVSLVLLHARADVRRVPRQERPGTRARTMGDRRAAVLSGGPARMGVLGGCRMSDTSRQVLDVAALAAAIETVTRHRKISMRDVAAETGLSASTLTRLTQGQKPDADGLVTLLAWLNAEASTFAVDRRA